MYDVSHREGVRQLLLPTPIVGSHSSGTRGAPGVLPRDASNGLEDATIKRWCYWDGQIVKGPDGRCRLFASRWDQAKGHDGWRSSVAVHAVSDRVDGPYRDTGPMWPDDQGGKGHIAIAARPFSALGRASSLSGAAMDRDLAAMTRTTR